MLTWIEAHRQIIGFKGLKSMIFISRISSNIQNSKVSLFELLSSDYTFEIIQNHNWVKVMIFRIKMWCTFKSKDFWRLMFLVIKIFAQKGFGWKFILVKGLRLKKRFLLRKWLFFIENYWNFVILKLNNIKIT